MAGSVDPLLDGGDEALKAAGLSGPLVRLAFVFHA